MEKVIYNIYCDESCHLEHDGVDIMVLGAVTCPDTIKQNVYEDIRKIKSKHNISTWAEAKWTKISQAKAGLYIDLIDYFFENKDLSFRGVVATCKKELDHKLFNQGSYDLWYYKMYYVLLDPMIMPPEEYKIFIDIKDTRGGPKLRTLHDVLSNNKYDFKHDVIRDIKQIRSHESEVMQLTDLFIGALSFYNRGLYFKADANLGKKQVISRIIEQREIDLSKSTSKFEQKFNVFIWRPRGCF